MIDISALLSAVKPKDRTDQYVILSALWVLRAHLQPATAKQIGDLLRLHMGTKAPSNINASLRAYKAYASPAEKGPPLRWSLTDRGVQHLSSLSALTLPVSSDASATELLRDLVAPKP